MPRGWSPRTLPGAHSCNNQGAWGELNPSLRPPQGRVPPVHYTPHRDGPEPPSSPGWNRTTVLPHVTGTPCLWATGLSVPRPGVEPGTPRSKRGMISVSPPGYQVDLPGVEPGFPACRAGVVPLDHRPVTAVDRRGIEPRFPACDAGVFPLDEQPVLVSGDDGNRTHLRLLARHPRRPLEHASPSWQWAVQESNLLRTVCKTAALAVELTAPLRLRTVRRRLRRQSARAPPGLSFLPTADAPPASMTKGRFELPRPVGTGLSSPRVCRFHHLARKSRVRVLRPAGGGYEPLLDTGPPGKKGGTPSPACSEP